MPDAESEVIIDKMKVVNANVVNLTVGDELSGEIDQIVAGEATVDALADMQPRTETNERLTDY